MIIGLFIFLLLSFKFPLKSIQDTSFFLSPFKSIPGYKLFFSLICVLKIYFQLCGLFLHFLNSVIYCKIFLVLLVLFTHFLFFQELCF